MPLGPNFGVQPEADKDFYFRLIVKKMHAFVVLTEKYLQQYFCNGKNLMAAVNFINAKTEIQNIIIELQNH